MRSAPPVECPVGWSPEVRMLHGVPVGLAWVVQVLWWLLGSVEPSAVLAGCVTASVASVSVALAWWHRTEGRLSWDGAVWRWAGHGGAHASGSIQICIDAQFLVLLRFTGVGHRPRWLWVAQGAAGNVWLALRRALHAPGAVAAVGPA